MEQDFVTLRCPHCGGDVKLNEATFKEHFSEEDDVAIYMGTKTAGDTAECQHCHTKFQRKQKLDITFKGSGSLHVNTGGGAFVSGNINTGGGDFVCGNQVLFKGNISGGGIVVGNGNIVSMSFGQKITCPKCHEVVKLSDRFCPECGQKLK
jgi:hypothetical protein